MKTRALFIVLTSFTSISASAAGNFYVGNANSAGVTAMAQCTTPGSTVKSSSYSLPVYNSRIGRKVYQSYSYAAIDMSPFTAGGCTGITIIDPTNNVNLCGGGSIPVAALNGNSIILGIAYKKTGQAFKCNFLGGEPQQGTNPGEFRRVN